MLKVAEATAGERVLFRLQSHDDEQRRATVDLEPGHTMGGYLWIFTPHVVTKNYKFTGTVEYEGRPEQSWEFSSHDPTTQFIRTDSKVSLFAYVHRDYYNGKIEVRLGEDDVQTFRAIKSMNDLKD